MGTPTDMLLHVALLLAAATCAECLQFGHYTSAALRGNKLRQRAESLRLARDNDLVDTHVASSSLPQEQWLDQPIDHFDLLSNATYKQRYFVDDTFFDGTGPVFLCVGGEGPAFQPTVVTTGGEHCALMMTLAYQHKALVLALEHRYYGKSLPFTTSQGAPDFSTPRLQAGLSSKQAQADLASFVGAMRIRFRLNANPSGAGVPGGAAGQPYRWITFGGSYPGMMASWARQKYPHLIHASVSSSAPVRGAPNMQGYMNVVGDSLEVASVGGSPECRQAVTAAFADFGAALNAGASSRSALAKQFNVCGDPSSLDKTENQGLLLQGLQGLFPLQSNDNSCKDPLCNYGRICNFMTHNSSVSFLQHLSEMARLQYGGNCISVDYQAEVKALNDITNGDRVWLYQTCTEFGFYQTCDPGTGCPFTQKPHISNVESNFELCAAIYDDGSHQSMQEQGKRTTKAIAFSNLWSGADKPAGSRVLYVNGEVDPWHANSVLTAPSVDEPILMVPGASHHFWTHQPQPTDEQPILDARKSIANQVAQWLNLKAQIAQSGCPGRRPAGGCRT